MEEGMTTDISGFSAKEMRWIYEIKCNLNADIDKQRTYLVETIKSAANSGKYRIEYNSRLKDENLKFFISRGFSVNDDTNSVAREHYTIISW